MVNNSCRGQALRSTRRSPSLVHPRPLFLSVCTSPMTQLFLKHPQKINNRNTKHSHSCFFLNLFSNHTGERRVAPKRAAEDPEPTRRTTGFSTDFASRRSGTGLTRLVLLTYVFSVVFCLSFLMYFQSLIQNLSHRLTPIAGPSSQCNFPCGVCICVKEEDSFPLID